ncbi:MAG: ATP-dependent Clp protease proteolytic subunit [bacterium]|nr:ATP-dependent Clp protease proteolytic subunit [bacterium]MDD3805605.1 ATP-dependent Clp protease proteolytic subunit [bacterium]MDD4153531.1 ATP-dependent Clp protease proteolytic subunit [bacterium]MDD4559045.1 ATP-dependent Clp protease proteolytic subunit [bacterium]
MRDNKSSDLLSRRIVLLKGEINDASSYEIIDKLLQLECENPTEDITLYVNSPGGLVTAGLAIYDVMQTVKPDVITVCVGQACSMGAIILAGGAPEKRFALPNSRMLIHQPSGKAFGTASEIETSALEIVRLKHQLNSIIAHHTGKSIEEVSIDTLKDYYLTPEAALQYHLIDKIIYPS